MVQVREPTTPATPTAEGNALKAEKNEGAVEPLKVILYGHEIDLTNWASKHPGGRKPLLLYRNRDATEIFEVYHSPEAVKMLDTRLKIAKQKNPDVKPHVKNLQKEFADLVEEAKKQGLYNANIFYETVKLFCVLAMWFGGVYLMKATEFAWTGMLIFMMGVQQCGWIAHDYAHHSVFPNPKLNDFVGAFVGYLQTYELMWWKARHNTHHICTNEEGSDPDIETSPLLTYIHTKPQLAARLNSLQRLQSYYFLPSLCLLHVYWSLESLVYILARIRTMYLSLVFWIASAYFNYWLFRDHGFLMFIVYCYLKGFATGIVVFSTHYGEDRLPADHNLSLVEQTALTSRNITGPWILHQFCGAISYQIEHHLCPMMPRSNLSNFQPLVRKFFKEHGLEYRESSIFECALRNMEQLHLH